MLVLPRTKMYILYSLDVLFDAFENDALSFNPGFSDTIKQVLFCWSNCSFVLKPVDCKVLLMPILFLNLNCTFVCTEITHWWKFGFLGIGITEDFSHFWDYVCLY